MMTILSSSNKGRQMSSLTRRFLTDENYEILSMQLGKVFGDHGNFSIKFADYLNQAVLFFPQAK